ncbi:hypothetical protein [Candidatus Caldatribacterium sp.]|uniref:hypothetical protein n=1 Tax=Candidatus Caldatribacterium sp. TaxID=2282143 RepID=UPI00384555F8|nr:hypothetical protein [Candidatus Caldatribacterium sp.]
MDQKKALERAGKELLNGHQQTHEFTIEYQGEKLRFVVRKDTIGDSIDILTKVRKEILKRGLKPGEMQDIEDLIYEVVYLDTILVERPEFMKDIWSVTDWELIHRVFTEVLGWINSFRRTR